MVGREVVEVHKKVKNVGRSQVERKRKALPCEGGIVGSIPIDQPNAEDVLMDWAPACKPGDFGQVSSILTFSTCASRELVYRGISKILVFPRKN